MIRRVYELPDDLAERLDRRQAKAGHQSEAALEFEQGRRGVGTGRDEAGRPPFREADEVDRAEFEGFESGGGASAGLGDLVEVSGGRLADELEGEVDLPGGNST